MKIRIENDIFADRRYTCVRLLIDKGDIKNLFKNNYIMISDPDGNEYWIEYPKWIDEKTNNDDIKLHIGPYDPNCDIHYEHTS